MVSMPEFCGIRVSMEKLCLMDCRKTDVNTQNQ